MAPTVFYPCIMASLQIKSSKSTLSPARLAVVANDEQNQDIFWAIRGAGGGQFGVVTELVLGTHPLPENVVTSALTFYACDDSRPVEDAAWAAFTEFASQIPDLMDAGLTGTMDYMTGKTAKKCVPIS